MLAPDYITSSGPYKREENNMATLITVDRALAKEALAEAQAKLAEFISDIDRLKAAIAEATPDEPGGMGTVIRFRKYSQAYSYAAIRVAPRWYLTQDGSRQHSHTPKTWAELLEWIGERNWGTIEVLS